MTGSILERTRKGTVYGEREYRGKKISTGNSRKKRSAQKKNTRPGRYASELMLSSAPSGTRTLDTLIKSQVLYQLS